MILRSSRKGQGLVEYGILIGGVALVALAAVSIFGHKVTDLIGITAAALPAVEADEAAPIVAGKIVDTTNNGTGIVLDTSSAKTFSQNYGFTGTNNLVVEP